MSPIDPYLGCQAPTQDFIKDFLNREIPAGLLFYAPFLPQTGNQAWGVDKRIVVPTTEVVDSDGSYFAKDGLIRRARANSLRMEGLGGLIEGARTNLCLRSQEFEQTPPWNIAGSVTPNVAIGPDGEMTGDRHVGGSLGQVIAVTPGDAMVFSWYARDNASVSVRHSVRDQTHGVNIGAIIEYVGNLSTTEWRRMSRYFIVPAGCFSIQVYLNRAGNADVFFWGCQVEVTTTGFTYPTSYIPTVAASVTRARENIQYSNAGQVHCQAAAGTFLCAVTVIDAENGAYLTDTYDAGTNSGFLFTIQVGVWRFSVYSGGALVANLNSTTGPTAGETQILAACWQVNDFRLYVNGVLEASDVAGAAPTGINNILYIGQDRASIGIPLWGNLSHWCYYNRALTGNEIAQRSHFLHNQMARAS